MDVQIKRDYEELLSFEIYRKIPFLRFTPSHLRGEISVIHSLIRPAEKITSNDRYLAGKTISTVLSKLDIKTIQRPTQWKWSLQKNLKDKLQAIDKSSVIYKLNCKECD